jgi:hypothetical protein
VTKKHARAAEKVAPELAALARRWAADDFEANRLSVAQFDARLAAEAAEGQAARSKSAFYKAVERWLESFAPKPT